MGEDFEKLLIVRYGEVALKGTNKPYFEKALLRRMRTAITEVCGGGKSGETAGVSAKADGGLLLVQGYAPEREQALARAMLKLFGVASVSPAWRLVSREMPDICAAAAAWMERRVTEVTEGDGLSPPLSFKIFGKRADKSYPLTSPQIAADVGEAV
ncbi:MAG: THUMP domain-containing protein, partial [Clostridiales bacterium]|nr:THUMP domain-containing protein [Clostridiales bacterium]